jgi:sulfotransferase 6B1
VASRVSADASGRGAGPAPPNCAIIVPSTVATALHRRSDQLAGARPSAVLGTLASRAVHASIASLWWARGTRVLLTSVPKCGTHLLRRLLHLASIPADREVAWDIAPDGLCREAAGHRGQALVGHVPASGPMLDAVRGASIRVVFITRDPRAQVVSHLHHIRAHADHPLHAYFRDSLPDDGEALLAMISGAQPAEGIRIPDVDTLFRSFLPWRDAPGACATTFERLIGPRGGGSDEAQQAEVTALLRHLGGVRVPRAVAALISRRVYSTASPTFHIGRIGAWRPHFSPRHAEAFKDVAGRLLVDLGYERDLSW